MIKSTQQKFAGLKPTDETTTMQGKERVWYTDQPPSVAPADATEEAKPKSSNAEAKDPTVGLEQPKVSFFKRMTGHLHKAPPPALKEA